jgi:hypothetical protein
MESLFSPLFRGKNDFILNHTFKSLLLWSAVHEKITTLFKDTHIFRSKKI